MPDTIVGLTEIKDSRVSLHLKVAPKEGAAVNMYPDLTRDII